MSRLFLILVKKFGYAAARKMAPKYGISQNVMSKTMKEVGGRKLNASLFGSAGRIQAQPLRGIGRDQLKQMGRRGLGRTGPPQAPGRGLRRMEEKAGVFERTGALGLGGVRATKMRGASGNIDALIAKSKHQEILEKLKGRISPEQLKRLSLLLGGGAMGYGLGSMNDDEEETIRYRPGGLGG